MIFKRKKEITSILDIKRQQMIFYWNKFVEIKKMQNLCINGSEYSKLNRLAWIYFDKYMDLLNHGYTDFKYDKLLQHQKIK